jgi:GT2 family glycosyltransferase
MWEEISRIKCFNKHIISLILVFILGIAIVILNWNGVDHLRHYLPFVKEYSNPGISKIFVADNGSTDGSVAFIRENYPEIGLIQLERNHGFAGGYNLALEKVDADIFCLLNSDVRVTPGWLNPIVGLFNSDTSIAAIQPKILSDRDNSSFEHAGAAGGFIDKYAYPFCRGRIMNVIEQDCNQYDGFSDIFWASGACLFIRSDCFRSVGGFDSDFFAHMEEIDLCWRLKNQGYRIVYTSDSEIYHWGGATLEYNNPRKLYLNFRNSLWMLYKNYTGNNLYWALFKRMVIDTFAIVKYLITFDFKNSLAVAKAHLSFYASLPDLIRKRKSLKPKVVHYSHKQILDRSIVWQFFIASRKKYGQLKRFIQLQEN